MAFLLVGGALGQGCAQCVTANDTLPLGQDTFEVRINYPAAFLAILLIVTQLFLLVDFVVFLIQIFVLGNHKK